ncbi:MAG: glyoxalase [Acetobacteraceae bacterium]|nr:glyoxalase [Acetobacteraceae bacterium]MSP29716.1 glyoxalase [Acetobacteraceae bacterium]
MNLPPLIGIVETGLIVANVDHAVDFYTRVFGLRVMFRDFRMAALDVAPGQALLVFLAGSSESGSRVPGGFVPGFDAAGRSHFAFAIPAAALEKWRQRLAAEAVSIESTVTWPRGAISLYFRDPDGNLGELVTPGLWTNY